MKRLQLRSKDITEQLNDYNIKIDKKDRAELLDNKIILINSEPSFFYHETKLVPTLKYLLKHAILKTITVDMGAVKFVINGADIMRPGIKEINNTITKSEFVVIIDEQNKKPLAVGIALYDAPQIQFMTSGKVIKNIHYVGDELWKNTP